MKLIPNSKEYYVDVNGDVYSKHRKLNKNNDHNGYLSCAIRYLDGSVKRHYIHRLVAQLYLDNPENKKIVNHKNGIKNDNRLCNLEWVTHQENTAHANSEKLTRKECGSAKWATYSREQIIQVCELLQDGRRNCEIRDITGVHSNDVYMIRARLNWTHLSDDYIFPKFSRKRKFSEDTIRWVCSKIVEGFTNTEISKIATCGISDVEVCKIRTKQQYKDISNQYF